MGKTAGLGDNFYIAGYDVSGDIGSVDQIGGGPALGDVTAIKSSAHERLGLVRSGNMQFTTYFNPDSMSDAEHSALSTLPRTDVTALYFRGTGLGGPAAAIKAKQLNYDGTRDNAGGLTFKVQCDSNAYGLEWGIQHTVGKRTDTTGTTGTDIDASAATTFGAQAYLQVFSFTGSSATIKVRHSTDNSTYSDLMTFGSVTAARFQDRQAVTGTIDRYTEVVTSGTFTSMTFAVVFVRNPYQQVVF
jgi:hypothetical protein